MRRILLILIMLISLTSFSKDFENNYLYTFEDIYKKIDQLKPYDILVLEKGNNPISSFGHVFLVSEDKKLIEFKNYSTYFSETPIHFFFNIKDRRLAIYRYKNINDELINTISSLIPKYYNKKYNVFTSSDDYDISTYCSKFIYNIYDKAGQIIGEDIKLLNNDSWPILPYSFMDSNYLENIKLK